jgi:hypothetical protein
MPRLAARHVARTASPGKGKRIGLNSPTTAPVAPRKRGKTAAVRKRRAGSAREGVQRLDTMVRVGTAITFGPTGERLRVKKIEGNTITFEKLP